MVRVVCYAPSAHLLAALTAPTTSAAVWRLRAGNHVWAGCVVIERRRVDEAQTPAGKIKFWRVPPQPGEANKVA